MHEAIPHELRDRLSDGDWASWTDAEFERRASAAFAHQFETCAPYRAFCRRRGVTPGTIAAWEDVPAVPATAFKYFDFVSVPDGTGLVFRTSGTTRGSETRGRHHVPWPGLYRASLAEPFRRALLPEVDGAGPSALFLSLIPAPSEAPDSSLSYMVGAAGELFATEVLWLVDGSGAWRTEAVDRLEGAVEARRGSDSPVLVLGTALAFAHLVEEADERVARALRALPANARAMETGGFKGARRRVPREELYAGIERLTGIPRGRVVDEYGMTELLSQLYEPVLTEGAAAEGRHVPPPWLRVRALDPVTLAPVPEGDDGILAFFDLANLGSVCHVLTEDVGSVEGGRVRLRGRAAGSEPRGCSRAMDDLMSAARG